MMSLQKAVKIKDLSNKHFREENTLQNCGSKNGFRFFSAFYSIGVACNRLTQPLAKIGKLVKLKQYCLWASEI